MPRLHGGQRGWISDKARFSCGRLKRQRLDTPMVKGADGKLTGDLVRSLPSPNVLDDFPDSAWILSRARPSLGALAQLPRSLPRREDVTKKCRRNSVTSHAHFSNQSSKFSDPWRPRRAEDPTRFSSSSRLSSERCTPRRAVSPLEELI